jgi:hypothetical protein
MFSHIFNTIFTMGQLNQWYQTKIRDGTTLKQEGAIHPLANDGVSVRRNLRLLRRILLTSMILGTGCQIGSFVSMGTFKSYTALSTVQSTHPTVSANVSSMPTTMNPANNNAPTGTTQSHRLQFDVISIGSNNRPEYLEAQQRTWASDALVRSFYTATEEDDPEQTCAERLTLHDVQGINEKCREIHRRVKQSSSEQDPPSNVSSSAYMESMVRRFAPIPWMIKKDNPVGWLCAQKRFGMGLVKALRHYSIAEQKKSHLPIVQQQELPSFLLMVDDDTYFNMKLLAEYLETEQMSPQEPYVAAGCRITSNWGDTKIYPYGGFGVVFSQESLARLQVPIHCDGIHQEKRVANNSTTLLETSYGEQVCATIRKNLIGERPLFRDGMSLIDLMEAFTLAEPFQEYQDWKTGFCMHSDHFLGYFIEHYHLSQVDGLQTIQKAELVTGSAARTIGSCRNNGNKCDATSSLVCHYQSPQDMGRLFTNTT